MYMYIYSHYPPTIFGMHPMSTARRSGRQGVGCQEDHCTGAMSIWNPKLAIFKKNGDIT